MEDAVLLIEGREALIERFGCWPSFHDAEILSLTLDRRLDAGDPVCLLKIQLWGRTDKVDVNGFYILEKHTQVMLQFTKIDEVRVDGFNEQNVMHGLGIKWEENEGKSYFTVSIASIYGADVSIRCERIQVVKVMTITPA